MLKSHPSDDHVTPAHSREIQEHARSACLAARRAVDQASATIRLTQRLQAERDHWRRIYDDLRLVDPDYMAACCAYCNRLRTRDGTWGAIPAEVSQLIHEGRVDLTHGICSDCQQIYFPAMFSAHTTAP